MDHDTLMVFLPRGIITTSRGGPLGATNHERKKGINIDLNVLYTKYKDSRSKIQEGFCVEWKPSEGALCIFIPDRLSIALRQIL